MAIFTVGNAHRVVYANELLVWTCSDALAAAPERLLRVQLRARLADVVSIVGERALCHTRLTLLVEELTFFVRCRGAAHATCSVPVRFAGVRGYACIADRSCRSAVCFRHRAPAVFQQNECELKDHLGCGFVCKICA